MKTKTTRKAIVNKCKNVRGTGYCALQHLLANHEPVYYTSGVYGWNFDVYEVYGLTICTGYRNMPGKDLRQVDEYEKAARAIFEDYSKPYEDRCTELEDLLKAFCDLNR